MFRYASGKTIPLQNTNRVLRTYSFCNGMKTGYTDAAGHCLISSGSWSGKDMIAVVLGGNKARVWQESAALLAYGLGISETQMASLRVAAVRAFRTTRSRWRGDIPWTFRPVLLAGIDYAAELNPQQLAAVTSPRGRPWLSPARAVERRAP